jgi:hypothetical protein
MNQQCFLLLCWAVFIKHVAEPEEEHEGWTVVSAIWIMQDADNAVICISAMSLVLLCETVIAKVLYV